MTTRYLLPCECGQPIAIERAQAGLAVTCACGRTQTAPTYRELLRLSRQEDQAASVRPSGEWSPRQGLVFLGLLIAVPAGFFAVVWHLQPPPEYPAYTIATAANAQFIEQLPVDKLFELWQVYEQGFDSSDDPRVAEYSAWARNVRSWTWVLTAVAAFGVALAVCGWLMPRAPSGDR